MIHFKNKKVKYGILLCVALVLVIVFILAYRNANTRLPAPVEEYYEAGDVVEHNGLEICVANLYFGNMNDIVDKKNMPEKMRSDNDGLVIVFDVTNKKDENVNLAADFVPNVDIVAYPIGYDNQGVIYAVDEEGDTILKVNGKRTRTLDAVILEITLTKQGDAIKLDLVDKDNNKKSVSVLPTKVENEDGSESYIYGLGWGGEPEKGLIPSFKYATQKFSSLFRSMGKIIGSLFTGRLGLDSLSGPVGIYQVVGEQRKAGFENIIYLTAYISINVGFVNLIPFPAFDGGRALFLIIEKIRKKPVKREVENTIHSIGFVLLMILVVVITIKDVIKLF